MKIPYILLAVISILLYNVFLIQRDQKLFEAYDKLCATQSHPNCRFAK